MSVSIIVAMDENRLIGGHGKIPWHLSADLRRFKELTTGHAIVMGRKTFESIGSKPLPGRTNIVITSQPDYAAPGCLIAHSFSEAMRLSENGAMGEAGDVFVIGGEHVYKTALPIAKKLFITKVDGAFKGDAYFPEFNEDEWTLVASDQHEKDENNPFGYTFLNYERKQK